MITNTLLLKLKDRSPENIEKVRAILLNMNGKIANLINLKVEVNIRSGPSSYDVLLIAKYDSMADFEEYLTHPAHIEVGKYIASVLESSASVCYES